MNRRIPVHVRNLTSQQIIIPSEAVICQLQKAEIVNPSDGETTSFENSFLQQFKFNLKLWNAELCQIQEPLLKWKHMFSISNTDVGQTGKVEHRIVLTNNELFKKRFCKVPFQMYQEVKEHIRDMLNAKAIKEINSSFACPIVLVRKSDGTFSVLISEKQATGR